MLEEVHVPPLSLDAYAPVAGEDAVAEIRRLAEPLKGARVLHVNATKFGGGVAEILPTLTGLMRDVGLDAEWRLMPGTDAFFNVTKLIHNGLQGMDIDLDDARRRTYAETSALFAGAFEGEYDFVVIHDPQPAALRSLCESAPGKWIWRCHIDLTDASPEVWGFLRPMVEAYDAAIFTLPEYVKPDLRIGMLAFVPPSIDPLSPKNLALDGTLVNDILYRLGVDPHRPLIVQVSRFDHWKDPKGVIRVYRAVKREIPDLQLSLVGSMATDDPEGFRVWEETEHARGGDKDIFLLSNLHQVGSVQINAFQRVANVVVQKSLREGFGLTVSEALWKGRPVVGGRAGGIKLQVRDGYDGYLVDSIEDCARRTIELLADPVGADALGAQGREHVRDNFLSTRELEDWLRLFRELG